MFKKVIFNIVTGVIRGVVEYFVYFKIPLLILTNYLNVPASLAESLEAAVILGVFVTLNIISSNVKPPIGVIFDALSSLLGLLIVFELVFGTAEVGSIKATPKIGGLQVKAEFEFKPLIILLVGFAVLFAIIRLYEKIVHYEE